MIFIAFILFCLGLLVLIKGANFLVEGASAVALKFRISPMVIGLTIVAFGTSSPELVVSLTSALSGNTNIALGNVVGSNIANILVILGISAIIYPLTVHKNTTWKEIPMSFLGAVVMTILGIQTILDERNFSMLSLHSTTPIGSITFSNGLILLSFFIIFLYYTFGIAKVTGEQQQDIKKLTMVRSSIYIFLGLLGLTLGSALFVDNAIILARSLGVSELLIGLTIVALGTSMPELVTSVVAARKKQVELAVGNVVGSNIFNIFFILGITSLVKEIPLTGQNLADIVMLFFTTLLLFGLLFVHKRHCVTRREGILMLMAYVGYMIFLVMRG